MFCLNKFLIDDDYEEFEEMNMKKLLSGAPCRQTEA